MKKILVNQNKIIIVDDHDFTKVNQHKWTANFQHRNWYATGKVNGERIRLHHFILGKPIVGTVIDHINGNGLDNRRKNLRVCSNAENIRNSGLNSRNTSGFKGVSWHKALKKWSAYICINNQQKYLGLFRNKKDAAKIYNKAAKKYHKKFANLNNI